MSGPGRAAVVVVGGGPAGSAAAATLARAGVDVVLVHRPAAGGHPVGEGAPPGTDLAVAAAFGPGAGAFEPDRHLRCTANRAAWGGPELLTHDLGLDRFGPGWHLDRAAFDADLRVAAARLGATVVEGLVRSWRRSGAGWELAVDGAAGPLAVRAGLACDASGRAAAVARVAGARRRGADRLVAAVAVVATDPAVPRDPATVVEAAEGGWWYTAPVPGARRVVAFLTDGDLLDAGRARTTAGLAAQVAATGHVAAVVAAEGGRWVRPPTLHAAGAGSLDAVAGAGWVAAGDAASSFDPLSSQGVVSALRTGATAGAALAALAAGGPGGGEPPEVAAHRAEVADLAAGHRRALAAAYQLEARWAGSPFWARRRGSVGTPAGGRGPARGVSPGRRPAGAGSPGRPA